uniref:Uncharacterized protein n=1 Tax=Vespula pensylvanica TaxID=30213 RepID=A0A834P1B3_VESPE|nr:hypothetical protein H0235_009164 [Vespula pensylvanica]
MNEQEKCDGAIAKTEIKLSYSEIKVKGTNGENYQKIEAIRLGCVQSIGGRLESRTLWHVGRRTSWVWDIYAVGREELAKRRLVVGERKRRDSELHLVGKCSETLPSNIETRDEGGAGGSGGGGGGGK